MAALMGRDAAGMRLRAKSLPGRFSHISQMVMELPFEPADCFRTHRPTIVPARTLLSQLP